MHMHYTEMRRFDTDCQQFLDSFVVFVLVVTIIKVFIDVGVLNLVMAIFSSVIITVNYAKLLNIDRISPRNSICAVMT